MARSQQTFSKKEREKKKQKERKEKEEKREERRTSGKKSTFEEMFAYVDENGRLSSVPPDPSKKFTINSEDIQVGIPRQEDMEQEDPVRKGTVTFFNESKGYGFIRDSETKESVFVHISALRGPLTENTRVTYEVVNGPKGPTAANVQVVES